MDGDFLSFTPFDFNGFQVDCAYIQEEEHGFLGKQQQAHRPSGMELLGEGGANAQIFKCPKQNEHKQQEQQEPKFEDFTLEDFSFNPVLQTEEAPTTLNQKIFNNYEEGHKIVESLNPEPQEFNKQKTTQTFSFASLELLSNYGSGFKRLKGEKIGTKPSNEARVGREKLSAEEILRIAGARFVQFSSKGYDDFFMPMHPYGYALGGLSGEETRDVELVHFLLAAAEKVGYQQYERASRFVLRCEWISSACENPLQRVVFHFAKALRERIQMEAGRVTRVGPEKNREGELIKGLSTVVSLKCHEKLPFNQVMQFTGIQAIVENVASDTKIHVIDLDIRCGVQWTVLMQALANREEKPIEMFKVTAVELTRGKKMEATGKNLANVAESLNLPFSYKVIYLEDMSDQNMKEDKFGIGFDEAVVVYSNNMLRTIIPRPEYLENLMRVIRSLKPSIMVVIEIEANHNSPSFVNRFLEALFYYGAFIDCLYTCLEQDRECIIAVEAIVEEGIKNVVAMEGSRRTVRNVKMDVWRAFFARHRMAEIGFSESSMYHAMLVLKGSPHWSSCTIEKNGKSLIIGWKGTPIHSLSAWKFR